MTTYHGHIAAGFEPLGEAFQRNFSRGEELGAAFAAVRNGETIVDIWGGLADRQTRRPWAADTLQIIFSGTKGLVATCMVLLVDRGLVDLDAPVSRYWPEFVAAGKDGVLVRDLVSHTARLPGLETPVTWREATDDRRMARLLAAQPQSKDPRAPATYHALTFGWLCGELLRRVDGRSIGRFFADEIARPLELELWIGLPESLEARVSTAALASTWGTSPATDPNLMTTDAFRRSVQGNPARYEPPQFPWNEREWHAAEVPAANAIGTARSIARLYGNLNTLLSSQALARARRPLSTRTDPLLESPMSFGIGFQLQTSAMPFGTPPQAFGHGGAGGSRHGCWPEHGIGFSYVTNLLHDPSCDSRAKHLLDSLLISIEKTS